MKTIGKVLAWIAGVVVLVVVIAGVALYRADISYDTLEARYAAETSHYADLGDGIRIHYRDDGPKDAPVLVLVHGYGDSFLTWKPWIERLSPTYRVITLDLPGHGLSRQPDGYRMDYVGFADLIDRFAGKIGLPPFTIVGNSMGGGVSWLTALRHPDRVNGLVLIGSAGWPRDGIKRPATLVYKILNTSAGRYLIQHIETQPLTRGALEANVVDKTLITPAFLKGWVDVQRAPGHRQVLMTGQTGELATPEKLAAIKAPTLVLHGEQDVMVPVAHAHKFGAAIPNAKVVTYPNAGHLPQFEVPEQTTADLRAFLSAAAAPQAGG